MTVTATKMDIKLLGRVFSKFKSKNDEVESMKK
jgi:hypothetical protein